MESPLVTPAGAKSILVLLQAVQLLLNLLFRFTVAETAGSHEAAAVVVTRAGNQQQDMNGGAADEFGGGSGYGVDMGD